MDYIQTDRGVMLTGFDSFDIAETLECGQCFRYEKMGEGHYSIIANNKLLYINQKGRDAEFYPCTDEEFEQIWIHYFDLNRDYAAIKATLVRNDEVMSAAVKHASGIRILNQDVWECLLSFILSQNNNIPRIRGLIKKLSEEYGERRGDFYVIPTPEALAGSAAAELYACKVGFRVPYILDAAKKVSVGEVDLAALKSMPAPEAKERLMTIKGVGEKIADCVCLFSLQKTEVFPTDVWIRRAVQQLYLENRDVKATEIQALARERFGAFAGFAQQYLYVYTRSLTSARG